MGCILSCLRRIVKGVNKRIIKRIILWLRILSRLRCITEGVVVHTAKVISIITKIAPRVPVGCREIIGSLREVVGFLREIIGLLREIVGLLREIVGLLREIAGLLREVVGLLREIVGVLQEIIGVLQGNTSLQPQGDLLQRLGFAHIILNISGAIRITLQNLVSSAGSLFDLALFFLVQSFLLRLFLPDFIKMIHINISHLNIQILQRHYQLLSHRNSRLIP